MHLFKKTRGAIETIVKLLILHKKLDKSVCVDLENSFAKDSTPELHRADIKWFILIRTEQMFKQDLINVPAVSLHM